jgi:hypothetical protein
MLRPLVFLLVAVQLLLSAPMASALTRDALTQASSTAAASAHSDHNADDCPCCPDDVTSGLDCLAACGSAVALPVPLFLLAFHSTASFSAASKPLIYTPLSDPPLKPPPIA